MSSPLITATFPVCPSARFQPWVGEQYHAAGWDGLRLLIVGDSFWENEGDGLEKRPNLTSDVVDWAIDCRDRDKNFMFYRNVEHGLTGRALDERAERREFWERVAFINFFQRVMGRSNEPPMRQDILDARPVFLDLLDVLRPDAVLVTGTRVWNALSKLSGLTSTLYKADPPSEIRQWSRAERSPVLATWTVHPSYWGAKAEERFTGRATHDRITRFLTACRERPFDG